MLDVEYWMFDEKIMNHEWLINQTRIPSIFFFRKSSRE